MNMTINPQLRSAAPRQTPPPPQKPPTMVEKIVDKTYLGANYTASALSGGVAGVAAFGRSVAPSTLTSIGSAYKNLWKAETIGPNLKIIGSVVAAPALAVAAAVALPVSAVAGICYGVGQVDSSKPREFTIPQAASHGYEKTRGGWTEATKGLKEGLDDFGNAKLHEGQKPIDIPIIKTGKTLAMGVVGAAVGGVAGVITAGVSSVREAVMGIGHAFGDSSLNLPGKVIASVGAVVGGAVQGVAYGAATAVSILGHGMGTTWKEDSVFAGGQRIFSDASHAVLGAASPKSLLREKPQDPPPQG